MNTKITLKYNVTPQSLLVLFPIILATCVVLTLMLDMVESRFHGSSFYFSESFLFSSFWWIFLPFLVGQFTFAGPKRTWTNARLHSRLG